VRAVLGFLDDALERIALISGSAYPLASLGYANWLLRHYGYKTVFIFGLVLYGIGALCMWPAGLNRSFGGFCAATFVIGSGLGSLETAANPYLAGKTGYPPDACNAS
jgi:fucose permease